MTILVSQPPTDPVAYSFIQKTLGLTGGNLTIHLRKLKNAGYISVAKDFLEFKPRTWVEATAEGRRAFTDYLANLVQTLSWKSPL